MEVTKELLDTLYRRVEQVYIARRNFKPSYIRLEDDATFYCYKQDYDFDNCDEEYISASDLSKNLEDIISERIKKEEGQRKSDELQKRLLSEQREKQQKEERRAQYLKLKKEFE